MELIVILAQLIFAVFLLIALVIAVVVLVAIIKSLTGKGSMSINLKTGEEPGGEDDE